MTGFGRSKNLEKSPMNPNTHSQAIADPVAAITGFADA